jgi:hypothetical protein
MMRRGGLLWGFLLLMAGVLFLLDNLGFLPISALSLFFPTALILIGLWFLLGPLVFRRVAESRTLSIPTDGTTEAKIKIRHGAGGVNISSIMASANLLEGTFAGGVEEVIERKDTEAKIKLMIPETEWWGFPSASVMDGFKWDISLNKSIAFALDVKTGASKNRFDLRDLIITDIHMESGGNDTVVLLPDQAGFTRGDFQFGSARLELIVPQNVAARIKIDGALLDTSDIDQTRFPKNGDAFCSDNFTDAVNKVEINVEAGVGKVVIH